jgi:hypothetical protein
MLVGRLLAITLLDRTPEVLAEGDLEPALL